MPGRAVLGIPAPAVRAMPEKAGLFTRAKAGPGILAKGVPGTPAREDPVTPAKAVHAACTRKKPISKKTARLFAGHRTNGRGTPETPEGSKTMKSWEQKFEDFFKNRFNHLLLLIVLLLLTAPFLRLAHSGGPHFFPLCYGLIFLASNLLILKIMAHRPSRFWLSAVLFTAVFCFDVVVKRLGLSWSEWTLIVSDAGYVVFLAIFLNYLFRSLFNEKKVTSDSIKGGICIYLLLGVLWGIIYRILEFCDPAAFAPKGEAVRNLFYFSYVTLTTVGYGDIVPASYLAQTLAFMEAVTGQIFLAVFIARLMGLHIAHVVSHNDPKS